MESQELNRLPASTLSIEELVEVLVAKPKFRGFVTWDTNHTPGQQHGGEQSSFNWRSMNCDPRLLCSSLLDKLPVAAGPADSHEGNGSA